MLKAPPENLSPRSASELTRKQLNFSPKKKNVKGKLEQGDMRTKMVTIDSDLVQVRRNLEYLEEMYDTIFRKVNRLFVDTEI